MVGRERELEQLSRHLRAALDARSGVVLVGGEAGIGKTTLIEALAREALDHGALVLTGLCYDAAITPPYGLWIDLFRRYVPARGLPDPPNLHHADAFGTDVTSREDLFNLVRVFLVGSSERQPVVLILEDLHWADLASLELLRFIARSMSAAPMLVIGSYRSNEITHDDPLYQVLPNLVREAHAERIELRRLHEADIRALVVSHYRLTDHDVDRLVAYLTRQTEGNPLYLREMLRTFEEQGVLHADSDTWRLADLSAISVPSLIRQVILGRVDRLDERTRDLLQVAAIIGQEVPLQLWQAVTGTDDDALLSAIEEVVAAHLLEESRDGSAIRFTHALIRASLYDSVLAVRRRRWHRQIAEALIASARPDPDAVAYHLEQAGDARAVDWLVQAGERAQRVYAWLAAVERFMAAERMLATDENRAEQRAWLLYRIGRLLRHHDPARAASYLDRALRQAGAVGDRVLEAYARFDLGHVRVMLGSYDQGIDEMIAGDAALSSLGMLPAVGDDIAAWVADALPEERARRRSGEGGYPTSSLSTRRGTLVQFLNHPGRFAEAVELGEPYVTAARPLEQLDDILLSSVGDAYNGLGNAYAAFGRPEQALEAIKHAAYAYQRIDHHFMVGANLTTALKEIILPYYATDVAERRRLAEQEAAAFSRADGALSTGSAFRIGHLALLVVEGAWREARERAVTARQVLTKANWKRPASVLLAVLARNQGDAELAWSLVHEIIPQGPATLPGTATYAPTVQLQRLAVALALDSGDLSVALGWLEAHDRWLTWSHAVVGRAEGALLWAQYHHAHGDRQAARNSADRALRYANSPNQPLALIAIHRVLAQLDLDGQSGAGSERHLHESLNLADACAAPFERALTLLALAERRAALGMTDEARALLDEVQAICAPLAAKPTLARVDALRARCAPTPVTTSYPSGLTAREVEVLRLVAQGLTDAEVAAQLYLARRTVNTHLTSIYTKLRVNSRAAATRFAVEHNLTS